MRGDLPQETRDAIEARRVARRNAEGRGDPSHNARHDTSTGQTSWLIVERDTGRVTGVLRTFAASLVDREKYEVVANPLRDG